MELWVGKWVNLLQSRGESRLSWQPLGHIWHFDCPRNGGSPIKMCTIINTLQQAFILEIWTHLKVALNRRMQEIKDDIFWFLKNWEVTDEFLTSLTTGICSLFGRSHELVLAFLLVYSWIRSVYRVCVCVHAKGCRCIPNSACLLFLVIVWVSVFLYLVARRGVEIKCLTETLEISVMLFH